MACQVKASIIKHNAIFLNSNSRMICSDKNNSEKMYNVYVKRVNTLQEDIKNNSVTLLLLKNAAYIKLKLVPTVSYITSTD